MAPDIDKMIRRNAPSFDKLVTELRKLSRRLSWSYPMSMVADAFTILGTELELTKEPADEMKDDE